MRKKRKDERRGRGGVGRLMANAILNFHFDFLNPSLNTLIRYLVEVKFLHKHNFPDSLMILSASLSLTQNLTWWKLSQAREFFEKQKDCVDTENAVDVIGEQVKALVVEDHADTKQVESPQIVTGPTLEDRKSVFQGHAATVMSLAEVKAVMNKLKSSSKIARATHNMLAYRIEGEKSSSLLQDCDDDGEDAAGGRMLHLLQLLDVKNVVVVVSRWYGGIHLGPDRFKHINNAARQVLELAGLISDKPGKKKGPQTVK